MCQRIAIYKTTPLTLALTKWYLKLPKEGLLHPPSKLYKKGPKLIPETVTLYRIFLFRCNRVGNPYLHIYVHFTGSDPNINLI